MVRSAFLLALAAAAQCAAADETIPVVGLDRDRKEASVTVEATTFSSIFRDVVGKVHEAALPALARRSDDAPWLLRDVVIGVGIKLSAGLGPIFSVAARPRVRLVYSNSTHPKFPD